MSTMTQQAEQLLEFILSILSGDVGDDEQHIREVETIFRFLVGQPGATFRVTAFSLISAVSVMPRDRALKEIENALTHHARLSEFDKREIEKSAEEEASK